MSKYKTGQEHLGIPRNTADHAGSYSHLTYEELRAKIEDILYHDPTVNMDTMSSLAADKLKQEFEEQYPLTDAPDGWEEKRRAELEAKLPDGLYEFGDGGMIRGWAGKGFYISYQIAMEKYAKRYK